MESKTSFEFTAYIYIYNIFDCIYTYWIGGLSESLNSML